MGGLLRALIIERLKKNLLPRFWRALLLGQGLICPHNFSELF